MSNDLDEYGRALSSVNRHLEAYAKALEQNANSLSIVAKAEKEAAEKEKKSTETIKKMGDAFASTTQQLVGFAQSLTSGNAFSTFKGVVGSATSAISSMADNMKKYGGLVKGAAKGISGTVTVVIDAFEKAYGTFEKLSEVGAVTTFTDMKRSADIMQLNFQQTENILSKNSKELAMWGGGVVNGRKEFEKVASSSYYMRKDFQRLGIGTEQFTEFQLSYISQQLRLGNAQKMDTDELVKETDEYITEIDALSKAYGQSRKDIQAQRQKRLEEVGFATWMRGLGKKQQESAMRFSDTMRGLSGSDEFTAAMNKLMQNNFQAFDDDAKSVQQLFVRSGVDTKEIQRLLNTGKKEDADAAAQMILDGFGQLGKDVAGLTAQYGKQHLMTKQQDAVNNMSANSGKKVAEIMAEAERKAAEHKAEQETQNAKLADSMQAIEAVQRNFAQLATDADWAAKGMNALADAMDTFTEQVLTDSGQKLPETVSAKKELRTATAKVETTKAEYEKFASGEATNMFGMKYSEQVNRVYTERAKKEYEAAQAEQLSAKQKLSDAMARSGNADPRYKSEAQKTRESYRHVTHTDTKTGQVTTGYNAQIANQEAALPQDTSASSSSTSSVSSPPMPTQSSTASTPTSTVATQPTAPISSSSANPPPKPTASEEPTKMRTGGMITSSITPGGVEDDTDESVSSRSLDTNKFTSNKTDVDFEEVYEGVSRKLDQLISLMSSTAREKKKQLQMKMS